jgi:hypothetical protein
MQVIYQMGFFALSGFPGFKSLPEMTLKLIFFKWIESETPENLISHG